MSTPKKIIKWSLISMAGLILLIVGFGYWFVSLLPTPLVAKAELEATTASDLAYLTEDVVPRRGKILAVVTSASKMGESEQKTGYELTELARAYYVFEANGYEVDIASPLGGLPPVVIDKEDMKAVDYAFLNDPVAQDKVSHTIPVSEVDPTFYSAIFFVGGKGAMFDFPDDTSIHSVVRTFYEEDKVIGAVCHGPAALLNVRLSDGRYLLQGKKVSSFTSEEELFLIPDAREIFPYLLDEELIDRGADFKTGAMYLQQVSVDGKLVTGQNPWSTWRAAESIIVALGHEVKPRNFSPEERSVLVLGVYEKLGHESAKAAIAEYCVDNPYAVDREQLAVHSIVSAMQWNFGKTVELIQLLRFSNKFLQ